MAQGSIRRGRFWMGLFVMTLMLTGLPGAGLLGVSGAKAASVAIVEHEPIAPTRDATQELVRVLRVALGEGSQVNIAADASAAAKADVRIWVGHHPKLGDVFPGVDLQTQGQEELLIITRGSDIALLGHDQTAGKGGRIIQQAGTSLAVYTFMQRNLGVRWFWPGELGEHIPHRKDLNFDDGMYRYAPQIHGRDLRLFPVARMLPAGTSANDPRMIEAKAWDAQVTLWSIRNRTQDSFRMAAGHAFGNWAKDYHQDHPDFFAMQPDGTRTIHPTPKNAKLCISNPALAMFWMDRSVEYLGRYPWLDMLSVSPNDSGYAGYCTCEHCQAWDAKGAPLITLQWKGVEKQHVALTDRYARFWNRLAVGMRQRVTDRPIYLGAWAYGALRTPPVEVKLDPAIRIGFVGNLSWGPQQARQSDMKLWEKWSQQVDDMVWRPNLFHHGWTMPGTMARGLSEDFKFLAAHGLMGIDIDTIFNDYATRGLDYYTLIQLAWDPNQDIDALVRDYCLKAYGPAAAATMEQYFARLETSHRQWWEKIQGKSRYEMVDAGLEHFGRGLLDEFMAVLEEAQKLADADNATTGKQRQRVAFMRQGIAFAQTQMAVVDVMAKLRTGQGDRVALLPQAVRLLEKRDRLGHAASEVFAIGYRQFLQQSGVRKMSGWFGPLSEQDLALLDDTSLISLPGRWDFKTDPQKQGHERGWHQPSFDSSDWQKLSVYDAWGSQLRPQGPIDLDNPVDVTFHGHAWYRTRLATPPLQGRQQLWLELPAVDKGMTLYLNGQELATQTWNPDIDPDAWQKPRRFNLTDALDPQGRNVIAIKVMSEFGAGGIYRGAFLRVLNPNVLGDPRPADAMDQWQASPPENVNVSVIPGYYVGSKTVRIEAKEASRFDYRFDGDIPPGTYMLTIRLRAKPDPASGKSKKAIVFRNTFAHQQGGKYDRVWVHSSGTGKWETHQTQVTITQPVHITLIKAFITVKGVYDVDEVTLRPLE